MPRRRTVPTIQELLRSRATSAFVGRADAIALFTRNLERSPEDPGRFCYLHVHGQGGMGKTLLLRQYQRIAGHRACAVAWSDEDSTDPISVMLRIADDLDDGSSFREFRDQHSKYEKRRDELRSDPDLPQSFLPLLAHAAGKGGVLLGRRIPFAGAALDLVDPDAAAERATDFAAYIARRFSEADATLVRDPLQALTPRFLDGLRRTSEQRDLVLLFDTYEETRPYLEPWLLALARGRYGAVPGNSLWVQAGREPLDANTWSAVAELRTEVCLEAFTDAEAHALLKRAGIEEESAAREIVELSMGLPLVLAMLASSPPDAATAPISASETAIDRFLRGMSDPHARALALAAATPRLLSREVMEIVQREVGVPPPPSQEANWDAWLAHLPFAQRRTRGWSYHPVVRELMLRHLRAAPSADFDAPTLHAKLASHYRQSLDRAAHAETDERAELQAEWIYHHVCAAGHLTTRALRVWIRAASPPVSRPEVMGQAIAQAEADCGISGDRWGQRLAEIGRDLRNGSLDPGDPRMRTLFEIPILDQRLLADLYTLVGWLNMLSADLPSAVESFEAAARIEPEDPAVLQGLAVAQLSAQRPRDAAQTLTRALRGSPGARLTASIRGLRALSFMADKQPERALADLSAVLELRVGPAGPTLINRGMVQAQLGEHHAALADFQMAHTLDSQVAHQAHEQAASSLLALDNHAQAWHEAALAVRAKPICGRCWKLLATAAAAIEPTADTAVARIVDFQVDELSDTNVMMARGAAFAHLDSPLAVIEQVTRRLKSDPSRHDLLGDRAEAFTLIDRLDEALPDLDTAVERYEGWPWAHRARAMVRLRQGDHAGALLDAEQAAEEEPTEAQTFDVLFRVCKEMCDYSAALKDLDQAISLSEPPDPAYQNERGLLLSYLGRWEEAAAEYRKDLSALPGVYNLAVVSVRGTLVGAEEAVSAATAMAGEVPDAAPQTYARAGLAALAGDAETALSLLERAAEMSSDGVSWARHDMAWAELRDDPRFVTVIGMGETADRAGP